MLFVEKIHFTTTTCTLVASNAPLGRTVGPITKKNNSGINRLGNAVVCKFIFEVIDEIDELKQNEKKL